MSVSGRGKISSSSGNVTSAPRLLVISTRIRSLGLDVAEQLQLVISVRVPNLQRDSRHSIGRFVQAEGYATSGAAT